MSAADEVDALATRIEEIDELGAGDDATYGNDQWGLGAVLKQLIKSADVEGVRKHLELIDYHDEAVSAHQLAMAARLPFSVQYGDAAQLERAREGLLLLVEAADEQTLGQCVVATDHWQHEKSPGRRGPDFPPYDFSEGWGDLPPTVTVLHQFAWDGDCDALAMVLALPQCTTRLVNATVGSLQLMNYDGSVPRVDVQGWHIVMGRRSLDDLGPGTTPLHIACLAGQAGIVQMLLRDGRADPNYPNSGGLSPDPPLIIAVSGAVMFSGQINHRIAECVRALARDPRTKVDVWYQKYVVRDPNDHRTMQCHVLHKLARYGYLEIAYHVLAALPNRDPDSLRVIAPGYRDSVALGTYTTPVEICAAGPPMSCSHFSVVPTLCFLMEVSNAGSFRKWRATKARELMVTRALVARARGRGEFCATASLAHGLFNLRDDAIFLHVLGFCWFLDPHRRVVTEWDILRSQLRKEGKSSEEAMTIVRDKWRAKKGLPPATVRV